jgi:2-keto-3-deoxy-L-rhamnonate aldolase RhmA
MTLKQQLQRKKPLLGTFVKTTHYHNTEVLAHTQLNLLCLDSEHAPFDRGDLDACVLAAKAHQMPVVIRVANSEPSTLLNALDIGADGVVLPHIVSADQAQNLVSKCFFGDGGRGYAGSSRFAGYTTKSITENISANKQQTCVIAQIEDLSALDEVDGICQVDGIDCIFVGRMDLTVSLGTTDPNDEKVIEAVNIIIETAHKYNKTTGMFIADINELPHWINKGVSLFLLGSDHGFILAGANALSQKFNQALTQKG